MAVSLVEPEQGLDGLRDAWDRLADSSSEPNVYLERWMLEPALRYLKGDEKVSLLTISDDSDPSRLIALFPVVESSKYRGLPLRHLSLWKHVHSYLGTPLVRAGSEAAAIEQLSRWSSRMKGLFLLFPYMHDGGPVSRAIRSNAERRKLSTDALELHRRALLDTTLDAKTYLEKALSSKHRKDLKKKRSKLAEEGSLTVETLTDDRDMDGWISEFLTLEASGWKGEKGSALNAKESDRRFFEEIVRGAASRGALLRLAMRLDGRPVAMKCVFTSGDTAFTWKIAFDEQYSRCSPGALLFMELMEVVGGHKTPVRWVDSCAEPGHPMLTRIWKEERPICSLAVSNESLMSKAVLGTLAKLVEMKRSRAAAAATAPVELVPAGENA